MTSKQRVDAVYILIKKYKNDERLNRLLSNGFIPDELKEELEKVASELPVADNDESDFYKSQFSTWFAENPDKIIGKEVEGSGFINPVKTIGKVEELDIKIPSEGFEKSNSKKQNQPEMKKQNTATETTYERLKKVFPSLKQNDRGIYVPSSANSEKYIIKKAKDAGVDIIVRSMENDGTDLYDAYITESAKSSIENAIKSKFGSSPNIGVYSMPRNESNADEKTEIQAEKPAIKQISIESKNIALRILNEKKNGTEKQKEILTIEDTLAMYNPHITEAEIKGWVYYKRLFGNPMRGWEKYYLHTTSAKEVLVYSKVSFYAKNQQFLDVKLIPSDTLLGRKTKFKNEYDDKTYIVIRTENNELYYVDDANVIEKEIGNQVAIDELKELVKQKGLCYKSGEYVPVPIYTFGNIYDIKDELLGTFNREENKITGGYYQDIVNEFGIEIAEWHKQILEDAIKIKGEYYFNDPSPSRRPFISSENPISNDFKIKELSPDAGVNFEQLFKDSAKRRDRYKNYDYDTEYSLFEAYKLWFEGNVNDSMLEKTTKGNIIDYYFNNRKISGDLDDKEKDEIRLNARIYGEKFYAEFLATALLPNDIAGLNIMFNRTYDSVSKLNLDKVPVAFESNGRMFNTDFRLKPVQRNGIAFMAATNSGCLAYDVGFGKTACAIHNLASLLKQSAIKRPLIVVPKPVYNNWIREMFGYWTDGKEKRFEEFNNSHFVNGALTGTKYKLNTWYNLSNKVDYKNELIDADTITLLTYEGFYKLGFSEKLHEELFDGLYSILTKGKTSQGASDKATARAREKEKEKIRQYLGIGMQETVIDIDVCGFDYLVVDEAHAFKNVFNSVPLDEQQKNVWRLPSKQYPTKRAVKLFFHSIYIQKKYNGNVNLLTATPFTNSPLEIFSMLSLVGYETLRNYNLQNLYEFLGLFIETEVEYAVNHMNEIVLNTVIKSFKNKNLLRDILYRHFDYQDDPKVAGVKRPCKVNFPNKKVNTYLTMSDAQIEGQQIVRDEAASYDPKTNRGAMGRALNWAKNNAFSPYLLKDVEMYQDLEEFVSGSPKIKYTIDAINSIKKYHAKRGEEMSGQVIYSNRGVNLFEDIKSALEEMCGFERNVEFGDARVDEIEILTGGGTDKEFERKEIVKDAFNKGYVKIIIGTSTIKEGVNLQERGTCLFNLDLDWNPSDFKQLEGRIHRQGNKFKYVRIVVPMVQNTLDSFINQKLDEKGKRISSIWDKTNTSNNIEENNAVDPMEIKFALIDDPYELLKMKLDKELQTAVKASSLAEEKFEAVTKLSEALNSFRDSAEKIKTSLLNTFENHKKYAGYLGKHANKSNISATAKKAIDDLLVKVNENIVLFEDFYANGNYKSLFEAFRNLRVKSYTFKNSANETKDYSDLVEEQTKQSYYGSLDEYSDWDAKFLTVSYGDVKKLERMVLAPYGLTVDDNFSKIKTKFKQEHEALVNEIEFYKSPEYKEKAMHDIKQELQRRASERGTIEERVEEFAKFNYLLSYPFSTETTEYCELPTDHEDFTGDKMFDDKTPEAQVSEIVEVSDIKSNDIKKSAVPTNEATENTETKHSVSSLKLKLEDIRDFMPIVQYKLVNASIREFEAEILNLHKIIKEMPATYESEESEPIVYLHYFSSVSDWFIKEKDQWKESDPETRAKLEHGKQHQAYGYAVLNNDFEYAEHGYVSIEELRRHTKVELDFHFKPKLLSKALTDIGAPKQNIDDSHPLPDDTTSEAEEVKEAIEMIKELLPSLKGKDKKEANEAIEMLKTLL